MYKVIHTSRQFWAAQHQSNKVWNNVLQTKTISLMKIADRESAKQEHQQKKKKTPTEVVAVAVGSQKKNVAF